MATTLDRFREVLKPVINAEVNEQTVIRSLHLDALDLAMLVTDLEEHFAIEIDDGIAEGKLKTVGDYIKYIDRQVANTEQTARNS